jgi:L-fucono-1,5-lactonase
MSASTIGMGNGTDRTPMIVDAHHHLMDPGRVEYRVLQHLPELDRVTGPDDLAPLLAEAGVSKTVVVQAEDSAAEHDHLVDLATRTAWIAGVVGWVPLDDPDTTDAVLRRDEDGPLVGIRCALFWQPDPKWLFQDAVVESLAMLADRGLAYDLLPYAPEHFDAIAMLGERVPDLRIVLNHMGHPPIKDGGWEPWATDIARAAEHPGCVLKLSGMEMSTRTSEPDAFRRYTDHALQHFGPERVLWGSNWPVSLLLQGYRVLLDTAHDLLAGCTADERAAVLGGNAIRAYRLSSTPAAAGQ